jgi:diguanylate cyclase (GGDEF)-like protein/PAS domain S-box-containing protein
VAFFQSLFAFGSAHSELTIATSFTAAAILLLGVAVLVGGRGSRLSFLFFLIAAASAGWLGCFALMYAIRSERAALALAHLGGAFAAAIPAAVFHFSAVYAGITRKRQRWVIAGWAACGVMAVLSLTTSVLTTGLHHYSWGVYPAASEATYAWLLLGFALSAGSVALLMRAGRNAEGRGRSRARGVTIAFVAALFGAIDFLPAAGVDILPLGFLAMLAFVALAAVAIWRYHLVDLTPGYAAAQILATMKSAVIVVDMEAKIRVINRAAASMLGYNADDLAGTPMRSILDPDQNMTTGQLLHSLGILEQHMTWRSKGNSRIDVIASSSFVRDADSTPVGVIYVATDVTERRRAEQRLRESEERYRLLFEGNPLPMWVYDFETLRFIAVNDTAINHYGYSREEFLRMTIAEIRPPEELPVMRAAMSELQKSSRSRVFRHRKKDGSVFDAEVSSFEFESGGKRSRLVIALDVTEQRSAERRLRESEERYRLLFERNLAGVYRSTLKGRILDCNDALARIFGFADREELLATPASSLYFSVEERERVMSQLRDQGQLSSVEVRMRRHDGEPVWVLENMTLLDGEVIEGTIIDINDRKTAHERIEYQAYHDVLTGLPNRLLFRDRIKVALAHAKRNRGNVAVMFLDLDQFKLVNDSLGHTVGDGLLQAIGWRLVSSVRAEDTVARMGGDEFTILLADADGGGAAIVAQKILESVSQPLTVDGNELFVTTSIGIAIYPEDGVDAESLLRNSDRAMYRAKEAGRNNYQFAAAAGSESLSARLALERSLHHALDGKQFVVHYQPMIDLARGEVVGVEALVRWNHPQEGLMKPDDFIPIAEECGLIHPIGEWVLRTACEQMMQWAADGHPPLRVAVNLSARQFQQRDLTAMIERILAETGFPAEMLEIELTESTAMQNAELSLSVMKRMKEMGIRISIDDFGTGYSSLSYLKRFPIDTVKIDQGFVRDLAPGTNDGAIVSAVISMARALRLRVVAEGVETAEQLAFLRRENCEIIQGFFYGRPVTAAEFSLSLSGAAAFRPPGG